MAQMVTVGVPYSSGSDGRPAERWFVVEDDRSVRRVHGEHRLAPGTVLVQELHGRHVTDWRGDRIFRVTHDGLVALHNGFFPSFRSPECEQAVVAALKGTPIADFPGPRLPNGRLRDYTTASQAPRWIACPGSVQLCNEAAPEAPASSSYADEGTAAHEMAATCLQLSIDAADAAGMGTTVGVDTTEEMVEHVQLYLDTLYADQAADGGSIVTETSVAVPAGRLTLRGTFDALLWSPNTKTLRVYDLKFGKGVLVDVHDNAQLRIYAIGAMRMLGTDAHKVQTVEIVIVQPRRAAPGADDDESGGLVRRERLSASALSVWYTTVLLPAVGQIEADEPVFNPTETGCRWCPVSFACPALQAQSLKTAQEVFAPVAADPDDLFGDAESDAAPAPVLPALVEAASQPAKVLKASLASVAADLSPDRLGQILDAAPVVSMWLNAVEARALEILESGGHVPGRKLVAKTGNRTWTGDAAEVAASIAASAGIDPAQCYGAPSILSPAQMEKMLPKDMRGIVEPLTHKPDRGYGMAPESDKRPAVVRDPSQIFDPVTGA